MTKKKSNGNGNGDAEELPPVIEPLTEENALELLLMIVAQLGWQAMVPSVDDEEQVPGLIIGTPAYIEWIEKQLTEPEIPKNLRKKV
jgi:hypothetical protein